MDPATDGALVMPASGGTTNWPAPSFDPETGIFYVSTTESYSVYYLTDTSEKPEGYGGRDRGVWSKAGLSAIDYKTGIVKWHHDYLFHSVIKLGQQNGTIQARFLLAPASYPL